MSQWLRRAKTQHHILVTPLQVSTLANSDILSGSTWLAEIKTVFRERNTILFGNYNLARTKILDGIHLESKRIPSEKVTDLRKSWRNTPGHVFFFKIQAYFMSLIQAYFFQSPPGKKNPPGFFILKLWETGFFFQNPLGKKIHLDYLYLKLFSTWNFWT